MLYKININFLFYKFMVWSVIINVFLFLILHYIFQKWTFFYVQFLNLDLRIDKKSEKMSLEHYALILKNEK